MYLIWRNLNSPPDRFPTDFAPIGRKKFRQYFIKCSLLFWNSTNIQSWSFFGKVKNHHLTRSRNIVLERTATGGWRTFGNKVEKAKLSARSPFDPLLCTWILCSLFSPLVQVPHLIESQVDPGHDESRAKHCAVRALHCPQSPEDKCEAEDRERNVSVGDLAQGGPENFNKC